MTARDLHEFPDQGPDRHCGALHLSRPDRVRQFRTPGSASQSSLRSASALYGPTDRVASGAKYRLRGRTRSPRALLQSFRALASAKVGDDERGRIMASPEASLIGARLDEHHSPETNGRMAVCRRCGAQTDGPKGRQHVPNERLLARSNEWLDAQSRMRHIDCTRDSRNR